MVKSAFQDLYRELPSLDALLQSPGLGDLVATYGRIAVADAGRAVLARLRAEIAAGSLDASAIELALPHLPQAVDTELRRALGLSLRPVINATGVILHTNLGRAPLAADTLAHVRDISTSYSNLEFDLSTGQRGKRDVHVDRLFRRLFSTEEVKSETTTIVVNNNAAAVLLALNTLAEGGEVIVSRGELVEIGGSFRIPDVMQKSQATLREVGTTNRTRIADYERAINASTRLLLRVHRSNFAISGFTEQPTLQELNALAREKNIPLMEDLGSGALFDLREIGVSGESGVRESLRLGVDVVTYSGDKLLGGPQAGLITGHPTLVQRMRTNSLFRALRADKMTYAVLENTLLAYIKQDYNSLPALRMMHLTRDEISARAGALVAGLHNPALRAELKLAESVIGGGSAPSAVLPTTVIALTSSIHSADKLSTRLRNSAIPIIARVEEAQVLLDLRTVFPEQDQQVSTTLNSLT